MCFLAESLAAETKELSMITMITIVIQTTNMIMIIFTIREEEQSTKKQQYLEKSTMIIVKCVFDGVESVKTEMQ